MTHHANAFYMQTGLQMNKEKANWNHTNFHSRWNHPVGLWMHLYTLLKQTNTIIELQPLKQHKGTLAIFSSAGPSVGIEIKLLLRHNTFCFALAWFLSIFFFHHYFTLFLSCLISHNSDWMYKPFTRAAGVIDQLFHHKETHISKPAQLSYPLLLQQWWLLMSQNIF